MENTMPKVGTKEFNDLASACFGGKPKQETAVEFQTQQIGILVSKLFNDEISKAEFHFTRFEIGDQAKEMEKQHRGYTEEEVKEILASYADWSINGDCTYYEWFEQFKNK